MNINNSRDDLTDMSNKKEALLQSSASILAELSASSPKKIFIFII